MTLELAEHSTTHRKQPRWAAITGRGRLSVAGLSQPGAEKPNQAMLASVMPPPEGCSEGAPQNKKCSGLFSIGWLCAEKKKKRGSPFAYHPSLPKIAEDPAPERRSEFPDKHKSALLGCSHRLSVMVPVDSRLASGFGHLPQLLSLSSREAVEAGSCPHKGHHFVSCPR